MIFWTTLFTLAGHQTLSGQLSNVSLSSSIGDGKSTGPRIKAKKSRGVGISAEPQTLQNLKVSFRGHIILIVLVYLGPPLFL